MKAMILAGGSGLRFMEETVARPKPMVEVGGRPILWHLMKLYSHHGINDFIVCLGYKGWVIKDYFFNYLMRQSDLTLDLRRNRVTFHASQVEDWNITLVDTGEGTMTGGRIKRAAKFIGDDPEFCMTYGDALSDLPITQLIQFHRQRRTLATVTAIRPAGRFGRIYMEGDAVERFREKPSDDGWVNAGFFVLSRDVVDYIDGDATVWERAPMERLSREEQLSGYRHSGFWMCMDTLHDRKALEKLWSTGEAPWKIW